MRITQSFFFQRSLSNLQRNLSELGTLQQQATTGQKFQFASQDPVGFSRVARAQDEKLRVDQYLDNVGTSRGILSTALAAIQTTSESFVDLRPNILSAINGSASDVERAALAADLTQFRQGLLANANTRLQGSYLFGGTRTTQSPFQTKPDGSIEYVGDRSEQETLLGPGLRTPLGLPGDSVFLGLGDRETSFEGATGLEAGSGANTGTGITAFEVRHTGSFYGDEGLGGNGDTLSGVSPSASSPGTDSILGPSGTHRLTLNVAADGLSGTVTLNGGFEISFTNADTELEVPDLAGKRVYLDMSGVTAGFQGDVSIRTEGTVQAKGSATTLALDYTSNQEYVDPTTGAITSIDSTAVTAVGREVATYAGTENIFEVIDGLIDDLEGRTDPDLSREETQAFLRGRLREFDNAAESIRDAITIMGSRASRLDNVENQLEEVEVNLESLISDYRDVDIAEVAGDLARVELIYQATISVSSRLLNLNSLGLLQ